MKIAVHNTEARSAPYMEEKLNMQGFILWAREHLIPNSLAQQMMFLGGGYRELSNVVEVSDIKGGLIDAYLTEWARQQANPYSAKDAMRMLYEYGRKPTSTAKVLRLHRNTVHNYRLSAMQYLWEHKNQLGVTE